MWMGRDRYFSWHSVKSVFQLLCSQFQGDCHKNISNWACPDVLAGKNKNILEPSYCASNWSLTKHEERKWIQTENENNTKEERYMKTEVEIIQRKPNRKTTCLGRNLPSFQQPGFKNHLASTNGNLSRHRVSRTKKHHHDAKTVFYYRNNGQYLNPSKVIRYEHTTSYWSTQGKIYVYWLPGRQALSSDLFVHGKVQLCLTFSIASSCICHIACR